MSPCAARPPPDDAAKLASSAAHTRAALSPATRKTRLLLACLLRVLYLRRRYHEGITIPLL